MLSQGQVKRLFSYEEGSGDLIWKIKTCKKVKIGGKAGCVNKNSGYRVIGIDGKVYQSHRVIWIYMTGDIPRHEIDHINGDRLDNRWINLRDTDANHKNKQLTSRNKSGYMGVYPPAGRVKKWTATIGVNGKNIHLGSFREKGDAVTARKLAEKKYYYHENHGREALFMKDKGLVDGEHHLALEASEWAL